MNNVPPSVRAALKRRGQDAILQQEGDYQTFKPQIDAILHSDENINMSDDVMIPDYEEDLSPEEQKATDRIKELGGKYKSEGGFKDPFDEEDMDGDLNIEEDDPEFTRIRNIESQGRWKELEAKGKEMRNHLLEKVGEYWQEGKSNEQIKEEYKQTLKQDFGLNDKEANAVIKSYMDFASGSLQSLAELEDYNNKDKSNPAGMPPFHWEQPDDPDKERHIVIDEGPHKGERYDNPDDYFNSNKPDDESRKELPKEADFKDRIENARARSIEKREKLKIPFDADLDEERYKQAEEIARKNGYYSPNHYGYLNGLMAYEEGEFDENDLKQYLMSIYGKRTDDEKKNPADKYGYIEKQRFTRNPDRKDYDINDELMKNLNDYEYYGNIEDINKSLESEKSWKQKIMNERFRTQDDFDKIDRRISLLSDPRIQKYVNDRNAFNKQFENDYNEYKPIAKEAIIAKLLSDQDLYDTESDSNTTNDLYDQVNSDFAKKYGYERTNYGDMFKPGRRGFDNFLGDEERITMQDGSRARRRKLNKDKYLANLLDQGEITLADLRRLLK